MAVDFEEIERKLEEQENTYEDDPDELPATEALIEALGFNPDELDEDDEDDEKPKDKQTVKDAALTALSKLRKLKRK